MIVLEYKIKAQQYQLTAIDEAIRKLMRLFALVNLSESKLCAIGWIIKVSISMTLINILPS